jgi:hypothetical protein
MKLVSSKSILMQLILMLGTGTTAEMLALFRTKTGVVIVTLSQAPVPFSLPCLSNTIRLSNFIQFSK